MVETPADFDNKLHLGVGVASGSGPPWAGAEPGTRQLPGLSSAADPKGALALVPSSIINSTFTGLQLTCTELGLQGATR